MTKAPLLVVVTALFLGIGTTMASAQFTGPSTRGQPSTVAQVGSARPGTYVTLTGNIIAHQRGDFYTFRDSTGEMRVEIGSDVFNGRRVAPETNVRLMGEVDTGLTGRYVWVKTLDIVT